MTTFVFANNVNTTLASAASSSATTLTLASSTNLPSLSAGQIMPLTLNDAATGAIYEIVYVTAISGVTLTVVRAQEGTGAQNWSVGDYAFSTLTAAGMNTPGFPNSPTMPTPTVGNNTTSGATTAFANQTGGCVGDMRNLVAALGTPGTSITFTADEIIVESALGGAPHRLGSYSQTLNVSGTGVGGMDTGSAPASGYVAVYAIYNPSTSATSIIAQNATNSAANNVYSGSAMPAGYTLSGLISVWPTNGSAQLVTGYQQDRKFSYRSPIQVLSITSPPATLTSLGVPAAAPKNAKRANGYMQIANVPTTTSYGMAIAGDTSATEFQYMQAYVQTGTGYGASAPFNVPLVAEQYIAYEQVGTNTGGTYIIQISGYTI